MNSNKYFILIIIALIFHSCYKDKGNYGYEELNAINKIKNIEKEYSIYKGEDTLKITPEFSYRMQENKDTYEYKWILHVSDKEEIEISIERDLIFDSKGGKFPNKKLDLTFIAKNLTTGVSISEGFSVTFMNKYTHGTFILHENDGNSDLTLIKTNGTVAKNIYRTITGRDLKGVPVEMGAYVLSSQAWAEMYNRIIIFTNGDPDHGAVLGYSNMDYLYSIADCFRENNPPNDLKALFPRRMRGSSYYILINGGVYKTNISVNAKTNPYIALNFPEIENENEIDFINRNKIAHSTNGKLYYNLSKLIKIDDQEVSMPGKCFDIFKELTPYNPSPIKISKYHILVEENNNTIKDYLLTVESEFDWNTYEDKITYKVNSAPFVAPDLLTEKSFFANSITERYFYIAQTNKIYRYNYVAPNERPEVFYEFAADLEITFFEMKVKFDQDWNMEEHFVVCTYDPNKTGDNASLHKFNSQGLIIEEFKDICGKIKSIIIKDDSYYY
jgi:hypothetical protein